MAAAAVAAHMKKFLRELIEAEGPLPMDRYMALCLGHPKFGYYMTRDPLGVAGDFTTSPEISQIFGELIGIWCMAAWEAIGSPTPFSLVELGPGRGTLMADVLRATSRMTEFAEAARVHLVETSPVLREAQRSKLDCAVTWHDTVDSLPDEPMIFLANEFFDALPVRQFVKTGAGVFERHVVMENSDLALADLPAPFEAYGGEGLYEVSPISCAIAEALGARLKALGGVGLVIDYGHLQSAAGDTLQALKGHKPVAVVDYPGESDLTAHVDFEALAAAFVLGGADVLSVKTQGAFLSDMGLAQRLTTLSAKLAGEALEDFIAGAKRLVDEKQMGQLFKVLCVAQSARQPIYPFEGQ